MALAACASCGTTPARAVRFCQECGAQFSHEAQAQENHSVAAKDRVKVHVKKKQQLHVQKKKGKKDKDKTKDAEVAEPAPEMVVPPAATGEEAASIYKRMLAAVRGANRDNDDAVAGFKQDCKQYGQGDLKAKVFYTHLLSYFGSAIMLEHMLPQLVRLIPDEKKRKKLLKAQIKAQVKAKKAAAAPSSSSSARPVSSSGILTSAAGENPPPRTRTSGNRRPYSAPEVRNSMDSGGSNGATPSSGRFTLHRYADDPLCSICSEEFDLKRRRHRCRKCGGSVCNTCSPARMLISPEQIAPNIKDYDPAYPQRVCTMCAPILQCFQDGLNTQYANCHKENPHEAKTRLHMPYSSSLEKECRNAADILGNFFRPEFGADSDRYIPVTFLKKAQGIAFLTVIKAGLLITAKMGTGIVVAKLDDGSWSAPSAIGTAGIGGGLEGGGEIVEFMIILGSKNAVKVFHRTQVNIGGGLSVAVGPYGREANAQATASRGGINANFSYSHNRGLFLGISLHGAVITSRTDTNSKFYGQKLTPETILSGEVPRPRAAQCLYDALDRAKEGVAQYDANVARERAAKDKCASCDCRQFVTKALSKKCKSCGHTHDK